MFTLGQGPIPRKTPHRPWKILLGMDIAEGKRGNIPPVVTLYIVPQGRKNIKAEKDNGENGSV